MAIYKKQETNISVLDAAKQRIKNVYESGIKVYVSFSGGKDSIALIGLLYQMMQNGEIDPKQTTVIFFDEEAMFDCVIDVVKKWRKRMLGIGAEFLWFCMEYKHFNCLNSLSEEETFICWDRHKRDVWVRPMPKFAITYHSLFKPRQENYQSFGERMTKDGICIQGLRSSESMNRRGIMNRICHKGMINDSGFVYPIYDWKDKDVFKFIKDNGLELPDIYQYLWEIGTPKHQLRVSQFFSIDTAKCLSQMNEYYPDLMKRVCRREPNAYLVSLYMDTEMFRRNTKKRKQLEENQDIDYKEKTYDIIKNPKKYYRNIPESQIKQYKQLIMRCDYMLDKKGWKSIHDSLLAGDPKNRMVRMIYKNSRSLYDQSITTNI